MSETTGGPHGGPPYQGPTRSFGERFVGALRLDAQVYEEVEHDDGALGQAALVVVISAFAHGLGASGGGAGLDPAIASVTSAVLGWFLATAVIWLIGVKIFAHTSDYPELLRATGFASAPGILAAIGVFPIGGLRALVGLAVFVLSVAAYVVAVRQALDTSTGRAIWVCVLAFLARTLVALLLLSLFFGGLPEAGGASGYMP